MTLSLRGAARSLRFMHSASKYATFINVERYPIDRQGSPEFASLLQSVHEALASDGCAVLKQFVTPDGILALAAEATKVAPFGHRSFNRTNPYFTQDDPALPAAHPVRRFFDRSNSFVPADNFPKDGTSVLRSIHDFPHFDTFIQQCLQIPDASFHRYADPLADVIINVAEAGNGFPWHFDTNNFTATLAIQNADRGGEFEYLPFCRDGNNENFPEVQLALDGCSTRVQTLVLEPGDLQLFQGRNSLHRVAPLEGQTPRYVAIFSYVEKSGMVGAPERAKQLYGKALPIHYERAGLRSDDLLD